MGISLPALHTSKQNIDILSGEPLLVTPCLTPCLPPACTHTCSQVARYGSRGRVARLTLTCLCSRLPTPRWQGMAVETAAPGAAEFVPAPSVYARYSNAPFAVQSAFQVGLTVPPRLSFSTHRHPHPPTVSEEHDL